MTLHPNQFVHYTGPNGETHTGTVVRLVPPHRCSKAKQETWEIRRTRDGRVKAIKEGAIRRGEEMRCDAEHVRCMAEIGRNEGALIGAADWALERKEVEK